MKRGRDPIERAADDDDVDLQEIATWEPRTVLDRVAAGFYGTLVPAARGAIVFAALAFTAIILVLTSFGTPRLPIVGAFAIVSVIPALALAGYVYVVDVTTNEPLDLLAWTFGLAFVFASFAAVVNTASQPVFESVGKIGLFPYFLLVVAPGEELVKLLAVRFYAYRDGRFDAVIDGAVYGAVAGLGFATIENAIYVTGFIEQTAAAGSVVDQSIDIAQRRALAGPGHVIYSAIAGYYLGLAKFNREYAGALVVKGLAIAAGLHALYNITVGIAPTMIQNALGLNRLVAFVVFVAVFDGIAGGYLLMKLQRYRKAYVASGAGNAFDPSTPVDATELDPATHAPPIAAGSDRASPRPDSSHGNAQSDDVGDSQTASARHESEDGEETDRAPEDAFSWGNDEQ